MPNRDNGSPMSAFQKRGLDEAIAEFLAAAGGGGPGSARVMAACCGLELRPRRRGGCTRRADRLHYDSRAPRAEQDAAIALVVARWVLRWAGQPTTRAALQYVAARVVRASAPPSSAAIQQAG